MCKRLESLHHVKRHSFRRVHQNEYRRPAVAAIAIQLRAVLLYCTEDTSASMLNITLIILGLCNSQLCTHIYIIHCIPAEYCMIRPPGLIAAQYNSQHPFAQHAGMAHWLSKLVF